MPDVTKEQKQAWRRAAVEMYGLVSRESRREVDTALVEKVREYVFSRGARLLAGFAPMLDEPDVWPFQRRWLEEGGSLALPVWQGGAAMVLRRVTDPDRDLRPGRLSILEPVDSLPEVDPDDIDLAVIPGRLFSETCQRMGRGAGCYDRVVRGRTMHRVGVAYDYQIFPRVPASDEDEAMDAVITPSRVILNRNPR